MPSFRSVSRAARRPPGRRIVVRGLVAAGKDPRTPAAVVSRGTHPDGRSVGGELHEIAACPASPAARLTVASSCESSGPLALLRP